MTNNPGSIAVADPEGGGGDVRPSLKKEGKKRERDREGVVVFRPSIKHISMHSFTC